MELYTQWKELIASGVDLPFWQDFYVKFYQAFIYADRWKQYLGNSRNPLSGTRRRISGSFRDS